METKPRPMIGVGIIVLNTKGQVLVGERVGSFGAGTYQIPGGHLEFGKSFEQTARDEVQEETGLTDITLERVVSINNEVVYGKHYVGISFIARCNSGTPTNPEPEKSKNWQWYDADKIPEPLFAPSKGVLDAWKSGNLVNEIRA